MSFFKSLGFTVHLKYSKPALANFIVFRINVTVWKEKPGKVERMEQAAQYQTNVFSTNTFQCLIARTYFKNTSNALQSNKMDYPRKNIPIICQCVWQLEQRIFKAEQIQILSNIQKIRLAKKHFGCI